MLFIAYGCLFRLCRTLHLAANLFQIVKRARVQSTSPTSVDSPYKLRNMLAAP